MSLLGGSNDDRGFTIPSAVCHNSNSNDNERITSLDLRNCIAKYGGNLAYATK